MEIYFTDFLIRLSPSVIDLSCRSLSTLYYYYYYLLTYLITPWSRVLLEKLASLQLVKKFPAFYGTRKFLTAHTSALHLSLSWARPIQSSYPNPTSWRSILILSSHLRLGLPSGLFPSGFPTSTLYTPLPSPIRATLIWSYNSKYKIKHCKSGFIRFITELGTAACKSRHTVRSAQMEGVSCLRCLCGCPWPSASSRGLSVQPVGWQYFAAAVLLLSAAPYSNSAR